MELIANDGVTEKVLQLAAQAAERRLSALSHGRHHRGTLTLVAPHRVARVREEPSQLTAALLHAAPSAWGFIVVEEPARVAIALVEVDDRAGELGSLPGVRVELGRAAPELAAALTAAEALPAENGGTGPAAWHVVKLTRCGLSAIALSRADHRGFLPAGAERSGMAVRPYGDEELVARLRETEAQDSGASSADELHAERIVRSARENLRACEAEVERMEAAETPELARLESARRTVRLARESVAHAEAIHEHVRIKARDQV